ncbi:MAG: helix-turn-helix transcriptional regulator [Lachnospiraceae bacterium]|nr:helix-turn-helix transcriptional regulator [Lachnospiraceae bacterium]MBP3901101.1 helix-turn-helix transcriptional regulator [Blautia sp.]
MRGPKIKLNAARVNAGLTQTEAAHKLNRNKQTIVNWEKGFTEIKANDLLALAELYGMPVEYLEVPQRRKADS